MNEAKSGSSRGEMASATYDSPVSVTVFACKIAKVNHVYCMCTHKGARNDTFPASEFIVPHTVTHRCLQYLEQALVGGSSGSIR